MICLLCAQHLKKNLTFGELLFLKKEEGSLCLACYSSFEMIGEEHCTNCHKKRSVKFVSRLSTLV